jgi:hypothetical protein
MSTTVIIGYADGSPLEIEVAVDLLVAGQVVATTNPDDSGRLIFDADIAGKSNVAVCLHPSPSPATDTAT